MRVSGATGRTARFQFNTLSVLIDILAGFYRDSERLFQEHGDLETQSFHHLRLASKGNSDYFLVLRPIDSSDRRFQE